MPWVVCVLVACSGDGKDEPTDEVPSTTGDTGTGVTASAPVLTVSEVSPSVVSLSFTSVAEGAGYVEYGVDGVFDQSTPPGPSGVTHDVVLSGLRGDASWSFRFVVGDEVSEVVSYTPALPPALAGLSLVTSEGTSQVAGGALLTTVIDPAGSWVVIVDGDDGAVRWWFDAGHSPRSVPEFPGWSGAGLALVARQIENDIFVAIYDRDQREDVGTLRQIPLDAMTLSEVGATRLHEGHHDYRVLPDGTVGHFAYEFATVDGDKWASDVVVETSVGSSAGPKLVFSWLADAPFEPTLLSEYQESFPAPALASYEWTHSNSLMYADDDWFLMSKFTDSLLRVDRATGDLLWVMGGEHSDFTLPGGAPVWSSLEDNALWSQSHMSDLWVDSSGVGGFTVFDNGYFHPNQAGTGEGWTSVAEYSFDETSRTVERVWSYAEPSGGFTGLMGDVVKLDTSYLVGWSSLGRVDEITPAGDVVWQLQLSAAGNPFFGRVSLIPSLP